MPGWACCSSSRVRPPAARVAARCPRRASAAPAPASACRGSGDRKLAFAGAGTTVVAAGLGVLLLSGHRQAAAQRAVPVAPPPPPVMHLAHLPIRPVPDAVPAQLISPFTGEPVETLGRGLRGEDRQHRGRAAAGQPDQRGHRVPAAGGGRAEPHLRGVLLPRPRRHRPGAQRREETWSCSGSSAGRDSPTPAPRRTCCRSSPAPAW